MKRLLWTLIVLLPRITLSRFIRTLTRLRFSREVLDLVIYLYVRFYEVDMEEVKFPSGGFKTFGEFFVRPLQEGARPLEGGSETLVSPCDGAIYNQGTLGKEKLLSQIKDMDYTLESLVGDKEWNETFEGGKYATIYLSPRDYHRVHAPLGGQIKRTRYIPGDLWPVNEMGLHQVPRLFARNERVVIEIKTEAGPLLVVMVGALNVGAIRLAFDKDIKTNWGKRVGREKVYSDLSVKRGEELGRFEMGSTVVVIAGSEFTLKSFDSHKKIKLGEKFGERVPR